MLKIGITGHRDLKKEKIAQYKLEVHQQLKMLKQKYSEIIIYSSLADGADRLVIHEAIKGNIDFIAVLPMKKDIYIEDFEQDSKNEFEKLINKSKQLILINTPINTFFNKNIQYELASKFISDNSDILFALWDGTFNGLQGGTGETVKYHLSKNRKIWHLKVLRNCI
jgi:hypothetical protein